MRGIDRFLAAILLAGAIGGTATFARHLGTEPEPQAVRLTAPPPGHLTAPGAVRARLLVPFGTAAAAPAALPVRLLPASSSAPGSRRPASPHAQAPAPHRRPAPARPAVGGETATPQPQAARILAAVPLTPTDGTSERAANGHGRDSAPGQLEKIASGTEETEDRAREEPAPAPLAPVAVPLAPTAPAGLDGDEGDEGDGSVPAHAHGHGNGRGHSKHD